MFILKIITTRKLNDKEYEDYKQFMHRENINWKELEESGETTFTTKYPNEIVETKFTLKKII